MWLVFVFVFYYCQVFRILFDVFDLVVKRNPTPVNCLAKYSVPKNTGKGSPCAPSYSRLVFLRLHSPVFFVSLCWGGTSPDHTSWYIFLGIFHECMSQHFGTQNTCTAARLAHFSRSACRREIANFQVGGFWITKRVWKSIFFHSLAVAIFNYLPLKIL